MSGDVNVGWMLRQFWAWNRNLAVQERGARYVCFGHWGGGPRSGRGPQSRRWRVKPKDWWGIPSASETAMRKCQAWAHALARENGARREALARVTTVRTGAVSRITSQEDQAEVSSSYIRKIMILELTHPMTSLRSLSSERLSGKLNYSQQPR